MAHELPDYHHVNVPEDVEPTEYNHHQRRAVILERILDAGHPAALTKTHLADEFGCDEKSIRRDFKRLGQYVAENLESDHEFIVDSVFRGALAKLMENGQYEEAVRVAKSWSDWLNSVGAIAHRDNRMTVTHRTQQGETESYKVVEVDSESIKSDAPEAAQE